MDLITGEKSWEMNRRMEDNSTKDNIIDDRSRRELYSGKR